MKRILSMLLALMMLLFGTVSSAQEISSDDYTVAEKLVRQLDSGSGFGGTLQLEFYGEDGSQPVVIPLQWDYIHVLGEGLQEEEHRIDLAMVKDEAVLTTAHVQWKNEMLRFQADATGESWYELKLTAPTSGGINGEKAGFAESGAAALTGEAGVFGVPSSALRFLPVFARSMISGENTTKIMERFLTKLDIWLEGYRTSADIGRLDDGTGTIRVSYTIGAAHIKAQIKQMLVDLFADAEAVSSLAKHYGKEFADIYLRPEWQPYYLAAVDALPLEGDLTIDRTVSFTGETLSLELVLPYHDPLLGDCTFLYTRKAGGEEQPANSIVLETEKRVVTLEYVEYSSMTNVNVMQGVFINEPAEGAEADFPAIAAEFTLTLSQEEETDAEGFERQKMNCQLTLAPSEEAEVKDTQPFDPFGLELEAEFFSKPLSKAATQTNITLRVVNADGEPEMGVAFYGKTRTRWTPADLPKEIVSLEEMDENGRTQLLMTTLQNLMPILSQFTDGDMGYSLGVIGGADGPTAVYAGGADEPASEEAAAQPAENPEESPLPEEP